VGSEENGRPARTSKVHLSIVSIVIAFEVCLQQPGKVVHETRLDVAFAPLPFMAQTWHLWQSAVDMGRVQNQAVGYLFPMGPFFAVGQLLHLPTWLIQRAWISALLVLAFWGAARLADEWHIGKPWTRLVGAAGYALGPLFLARAGTTSAFVMGGAFLPWVLIPLVRGTRTGKLGVAACWSGIAVLAMGGVNASVTLAVLIMPALYLLTRARGPTRGRLTVRWLAATALACAWWIVPLIFQSRYAADFLSITERARVITAVTAPFEVVRGTADWLAYYHGHGASLPAGFLAVTNRWAIVSTGLLTAAGVAGIARRDLPERRFLVTTFLVGVTLVGLGYGGPLGDPAAPAVGRALDGFLGTFRTVYKFEPLIALPLALGLTHVVSAAAARRPSRVGPWLAPVAGVVAVGLVLLAAIPLPTGRLLHEEGFSHVPSWWTQTADYLGTTPGRALLVPGLSQSSSTWGYSEEEPLQWLTDQPWATRSIAPLGGEGSIAYLDTVEAAIERGGDPGLPMFLGRAGFSTVVARNDADWQQYGAPDPVEVNRSLVASGLNPVASFGPLLERPAGSAGSDLHEIEVYEVPDAARSIAYPADTALLVSGGVDSLLALADAGLGDRAAILGRDYRSALPLPPNWVITDGNQRRYASFGSNRDNQSYLLGQTQNAVAGQPPGQGFYGTDNPASGTVATVTGVADITASSYGAPLVALPEVAPNKALDGDPSTAWVAAPLGNDSTGQWLQVDLERPSELDHISVRLLEDGPWRPQVDALRVTTNQGSIVTAVTPDESAQELEIPPGPTQWIRVTVESVADSASATTSAGIRELTIPGVAVDRVVTVPAEFTSTFAEASANLPTYLFNRFRSDASDLSRRDEETAMARQFTVPRPGSWGLAASVSPVPSPTLLDLIDTTPTFAISATSTAGNLPQYAPRNLVDREGSTIWIAATSNGSLASEGPPADTSPAPATYDPQPAVTMRWGQLRTLDTLSVGSVAGYSSPHEVAITDGTESRVVEVPTDGVVHFAPLSTDHVVVTITKIAHLVSSDGQGHKSDRPLALSELRFPALDDLMPQVMSGDHAFALTCENGPKADLGNTQVDYSAAFTYRDLVDLTPVTATPCSSSVSLPAGQTRLATVVGAGSFTIDTFELVSPGLGAILSRPVSPGTPAPPAAADDQVTSARKVEVLTWDDDARRIHVGAGDASYLVVNDNFNPGWEATLDGQRLESVRVDGWRQGFVVPASSGGDVLVKFEPTSLYRAVLIGGAILVVALLVLTAVVTLRSRHSVRPSPPRQRLEVGTWNPAVSLAVPLAAGLLTAGAGAVMIVPLWVVFRYRRTLLPWIAGSTFALAAIRAAWTQQTLPTNALKSAGSPSSLLALVAILAVAATLLPESWSVRRPRAAAEEDS
jgi:arabinofuranan 3-O-arabinosyltransferase